MGFAGVIVALFFFVLHGIGAYRLWKHMPYSSELVTAAVIIGLIAGALSLLGILFNKRWGWPLALVMFSIGLGGTVVLYSTLGSSITLVLLFAVTVFAMLVSFIAVDLWEPDWEAHEEDPAWQAPVMDRREVEVADVKATVSASAGENKSSKKKSTRKKSSRKKAAKKSSRKKSRR